MWGAAMQLAVSAYKLKNLDISLFTHDNLSVWFTLKNAMNNILVSVS
jgi:hypothetical protein